VEGSASTHCLSWTVLGGEIVRAKEDGAGLCTCYSAWLICTLIVSLVGTVGCDGVFLC
jgi:hypothetical protein